MCLTCCRLASPMLGVIISLFLPRRVVPSHIVGWNYMWPSLWGARLSFSLVISLGFVGDHGESLVGRPTCWELAALMLGVRCLERFFASLRTF